MDSGNKTNRCNRISNRVQEGFAAFYTDCFSLWPLNQFCNCFSVIILFCIHPVHFKGSDNHIKQFFCMLKSSLKSNKLWQHSTKMLDCDWLSVLICIVSKSGRCSGRWVRFSRIDMTVTKTFFIQTVVQIRIESSRTGYRNNKIASLEPPFGVLSPKCLMSISWSSLFQLAARAQINNTIKLNKS